MFTENWSKLFYTLVNSLHAKSKKQLTFCAESQGCRLGLHVISSELEISTGSKDICFKGIEGIIVDEVATSDKNYTKNTNNYTLGIKVIDGFHFGLFWHIFLTCKNKSGQ